MASTLVTLILGNLVMHIFMCIAHVVTNTEEKNGLFDLIYFDQAFYKDK